MVIVINRNKQKKKIYNPFLSFRSGVVASKTPFPKPETEFYSIVAFCYLPSINSAEHQKVV